MFRGRPMVTGNLMFGIMPVFPLFVFKITNECLQRGLNGKYYSMADED